MTTLSKYQQVAKRGLELKIPEGVRLDMEMYCSNEEENVSKHGCSTSFCFAGFLALEDGYPEEYISSDGTFNYTLYSSNLIGYSSYGDQWDFLFSECWPNSLEALRKRCAHVLEHGDCPHWSTWDEWGII